MLFILFIINILINYFFLFFKKNKPISLDRRIIDDNLNWVKSKVVASTSTLQKELHIILDNKINNFRNFTEDLTWQDPIANKIISDDSDIIQKLSSPQQKNFMKLANKMTVALQEPIKHQCTSFATNYKE